MIFLLGKGECGITDYTVVRPDRAAARMFMRCDSGRGFKFQLIRLGCIKETPHFLGKLTGIGGIEYFGGWWTNDRHTPPFWYLQYEGSPAGIKSWLNRLGKAQDFRVFRNPEYIAACWLNAWQLYRYMYV